jgi:hypothetical protein
VNKYAEKIMSLIGIAFSNLKRTLVSIFIVFLLSSNIFLIISIQTIKKDKEELEKMIYVLEDKHTDLEY